jgi:osmotically inducible lipoprotein OsmB
MRNTKKLDKQFMVSVFAVMTAFSGCTQPGDTTTYAAATGGAIGAGLGAIVGSQVGSAGAGIAIGAAAGTGAGYAIGNAIEANEKKTASTEERLARQEEMLRAQRNEINNLKSVEKDSYGSTRDSYAMNRSTSFGGGDARYASSAEIAAARQALENKEYGRAQLNTNTLRQEPQKMNAPEPSRYTPPMLPEKPRRAADSGVSSALNSNSVKEKDLIDAPTSSISGSGKEEQQVVEVKTTNDAVDEAPAALNKTTTSSTCNNGDEEISKATAASDSADKLFHIRRALRLCPDNADYHVRLSDLYSSMNRTDDAIFELKEAAKLDPNNSAAKQKLQAMQRGDGASIADSKQPKLPGRY